jgi:probable phosphoglycerate mutase
MLITLARHGETDDNARLVFQGQGGKGLNRLGRLQAARLGERFRRDPPTAIVSSDLERAVETARIVGEVCGRGVRVEVDPGLREVDVGSWTGKSYEEVEQELPEEWAAWESGLDIRRGGGETYAELADRIDGAIGDILGRSDSGERRRLVLVSHGGSIRAWVAKILGISFHGGLRALGGVANTSLTVVEKRLSTGPYRLHTWNDSSHLEGLEALEDSD